MSSSTSWTQDWSTQQVATWLDTVVVLPQYKQAFIEHGITGRVLLDLDKHDLQSLGVQIVGHQKRIQKSIHDLKNVLSFPPLSYFAQHSVPNVNFVDNNDAMVTFPRQNLYIPQAPQMQALQESSTTQQGPIILDAPVLPVTEDDYLPLVSTLPIKTHASNSFKVLLLGDSRVGKTTWVNHMLSHTFSSSYAPTDGVEIASMTFNTTKGQFITNVFDVTGNESTRTSTGEFFKNMDAVIIMYDVAKATTYNNVRAYYNWAIKAFEQQKFNPAALPIVIVGNKADEQNPHVTAKDLKFIEAKGLKHYLISCKSKQYIDAPILYLLQRLTGDANLHWK